MKDGVTDRRLVVAPAALVTTATAAPAIPTTTAVASHTSIILHHFNLQYCLNLQLSILLHMYLNHLIRITSERTTSSEGPMPVPVRVTVGVLLLALLLAGLSAHLDQRVVGIVHTLGLRACVCVCVCVCVRTCVYAHKWMSASICARKLSTHLTCRAQVVIRASLALKAISDNRGHAAAITRHTMVHCFSGHTVVVVVVVVIAAVGVGVGCRLRSRGRGEGPASAHTHALEHASQITHVTHSPHTAVSTHVLEHVGHTRHASHSARGTIPATHVSEHVAHAAHATYTAAHAPEHLLEVAHHLQLMDSGCRVGGHALDQAREHPLQELGIHAGQKVVRL
jgi:hypothetical protein